MTEQTDWFQFRCEMWMMITGIVYPLPLLQPFRSLTFSGETLPALIELRRRGRYDENRGRCSTGIGGRCAAL